MKLITLSDPYDTDDIEQVTGSKVKVMAIEILRTR